MDERGIQLDVARGRIERLPIDGVGPGAAAALVIADNRPGTPIESGERTIGQDTPLEAAGTLDASGIFFERRSRSVTSQFHALGDAETVAVAKGRRELCSAITPPA